mmetsp:Transcript_6393/g.19332  ORF Transcript_6393/g.19332 Transcript_6393/m.19332 type:complete len:855 (+) Transcript_6393:222-2786(+)
MEQAAVQAPNVRGAEVTLAKWLVQVGDQVEFGQKIALIEGERGARADVVASKEGRIASVAVKEGEKVEKGADICQIEFCPHSVIFDGLCSMCGADLSLRHYSQDTPQDTRVNVAYETSLSVSQAEAERTESDKAQHLLKQRRLSLILDLDHTLLHATDDQRAVAALVEDQSPPTPGTPRLSPQHHKGVHALILDDRYSPLHVKMRPGLGNFLRRMSQIFELHIYTMGTRPYAEAIAKIIDPEKNLFKGRVTSRDDFEEGNFNQKNLRRVFPCDDTMVLIVDDREDVWLDEGKQTMPNLIRAKPYHFFQGLHEAYDRNLMPGQAASGVRENEAPLVEKDGSIVDPVLTDPVQALEAVISTNTTTVNATRVSEDGTHLETVVLDVSKLVDSSPGDDESSKQNVEKIDSQTVEVGATQGENSKLVDKISPSVVDSDQVKDAVADISETTGKEVSASAQTDVPALAAPKEASAVGPDVQIEQDAVYDVDPAVTEKVLTRDSAFPTIVGETLAEPQLKPGDVAASKLEQHPQSSSMNPQAAKVEEPQAKPGTASPPSNTTVGEKDLAAPATPPIPQLPGNLSELPADDESGARTPQTQAFSKETMELVEKWWAADRKEGFHLQKLAQVLEEVHRQFFAIADKAPRNYSGEWCAPADVKEIVTSLRMKVLRGCHFAFTGVMQSDTAASENPLWKLAERHGAVCHDDLHHQVTHLIVHPQRGVKTDKAKRARALHGIFCVVPRFLEASAEQFERASELKYSAFPVKPALAEMPIELYREKVHSVYTKKLKWRELDLLTKKDKQSQNEDNRNENSTLGIAAGDGKTLDRQEEDDRGMVESKKRKADTPSEDEATAKIPKEGS